MLAMYVLVITSSSTPSYLILANAFYSLQRVLHSCLSARVLLNLRAARHRGRNSFESTPLQYLNRTRNLTTRSDEEAEQLPLPGPAADVTPYNDDDVIDIHDATPHTR